MLLQKRGPELAYDSKGHPFPVPEDQAGWLLEAVTGGATTPQVDDQGNPMIVSLYATRQNVRQALPEFVGRMRCVPVDDWGVRIPDAKVGILDLEPFEAQVEDLHWKHVNRAYGLVDEMVKLTRARDEGNDKMVEAMIENQRDILSSAAELLRAAASSVNVASGIERPELDMDMISARIAEAVEDKAKERERGRGPWFVQLADTKLGQGVVDLVTSFAAKLTDLQQKTK